MDSETGLLQVHLLCSGSGAKTAWQWRDTKSLPVKEAGGRPPIKTQRLWVTFHRGTAAGLRQHANSLFLKGCLFSVYMSVCHNLKGVTARTLHVCECMWVGVSVCARVSECTQLPHYFDCFSTSNYLTTRIVIFYTGLLSVSSTVISTAEIVEKWISARFVEQITQKERNEHQK